MQDNMSDTVLKNMHGLLEGQITRKYNGFMFECAFSVGTKRINKGQKVETIIKYRSHTKGDYILNCSLKFNLDVSLAAHQADPGNEKAYCVTLLTAGPHSPSL